MDEKGQMYFDESGRIPGADKDRLKEAQRELAEREAKSLEAALTRAEEEEGGPQPEDRPGGEAVDEEAREGDRPGYWIETPPIPPEELR